MMAAAMVAAMVALLLAYAPARAATDRLPDLGMDRLVNLRIKNCTDTSKDCAFVGQRQLRFDTIIVNVGAGRFEARGSRPIPPPP